MATYTAGDQINRALRLLGVLAEGETPSASESQDALMALNQMIDSWNTERLSVFSTIDQKVLFVDQPQKRALLHGHCHQKAFGALDALLGTGYAHVLLKGGICLHAASVLIDGRAWVFAGQSGAGKTTLSQRFGDAWLDRKSTRLNSSH